MDEEHTVRSRRRGEALMHAIHAAVLEELAVAGYGGLTMEGVAARAGTGKAPLYRRWRTKDDLILDTVRHGIPTGRGAGYSGDVRADLRLSLKRLAEALDGPVGGAMRALLGETHRRPALLAALDEAMFEPRGAELRALLHAAADAGEIRPDMIDHELASAGHEMVMFRFLTEGSPVPDATIDGILDHVVLPLLRRPEHAVVPRRACGRAAADGTRPS